MIEMHETNSFRVRFRFRVQSKLHLKAHEHSLIVGDREVSVSAQSPDAPICDSEWLVINARGFESENDAKRFAHKLKVATEISSVAARLGIDSGIDLATTTVGKAVKEHFLRETGTQLRGNVHGIDVFPDDDNVRFPLVTGIGSVLKDPEPFLGDLTLLLGAADRVSASTRSIVLLLNFALMRAEPVAQIVFAFSAVEMLGQQRYWSKTQKDLLEQLATAADNSVIGTAEERQEVAAAIRRGAQRVSLNQGVMRLLDSIGLQHLKGTWEALYVQRNTLIHGLAPQPGANYTQLAYETVNLCGHILLQLIAKEIPSAANHIDKFYKIPGN